MPSLHDLPPELIDQVHHHLEDLLIAGRPPAEQAGVAEDLGQFRLVSSYIQRATRRSYVETWFVAWCIKSPDDASIRKFCAMTKTADLAKAITEIVLYVDDDYSMREQDGEMDLLASMQRLSLNDDEAGFSEAHKGESTTTARRHATHIFDDVTGTMVPAAYHRNSYALLEAFRACGNVTALCFANVPLDVERLGQYKREGPDLGVEGEHDGEDDGEDDADGDDGEEDGQDENKVDDEDEDTHESEAEAESDRENDSEDDNGDEVDEEVERNEHEHDHDHRNLLFDVTSSYFYVLFLAGQAGMCPQNIKTFHTCSERHCACITLGLTDCAGLVAAKSALEKLETLKLDFIEDKHGTEATSEEVGLRLGRQAREGIAHIPVLKHLLVNFEYDTSATAWSILAKAPAIPTLQTINLGMAVMALQDFTEFLGKHSATWKSIAISRMHLTGGRLEDLGRLYGTLSQAPDLEHYHQGSLHLGVMEHERIGYPAGVCYPVFEEDEDEDGFIMVYQTDWIMWNGHKAVTRALGEIARHLLRE